MSEDNFIAYIGIIVQWRYPNARLWQRRIILNAGARGLINLTYDEAQSEFRRITFAILNLIKAPKAPGSRTPVSSWARGSKSPKACCPNTGT